MRWACFKYLVYNRALLPIGQEAEVAEAAPQAAACTGYICLAVYRPRPDLLRTQIQTIRAQTVRDWRCVIGIDGSDSEAFELVRDLVDGDERFMVYEYAENLGFYRNFERVLESVPPEAAWVALADQDDDWFPDKLEMLLPGLDSASLVVGGAILVGDDGAPIGPVARRRINRITPLMIDNQVTGSLSVMKADLLRVALPFPVATELAFHDHWLAVCAIASDGIHAVDRPVQHYVQHSRNVIGEAQRTPVGHRLMSLGSKSEGGLRAMLDYLAEQRWGWRVSMAVSLQDRRSELTDVDRHLERELLMFARDRVSGPLLSGFGRAVIRGQAPLLRAFALFVGAMRSRGRIAARLGVRSAR